MNGKNPPSIVRKPNPPRQAKLKRPMTAKHLDELKKRSAMIPDKATDS